MYFVDLLYFLLLLLKFCFKKNDNNAAKLIFLYAVISNIFLTRST